MPFTDAVSCLCSSSFLFAVICQQRLEPGYLLRQALHLLVLSRLQLLKSPTPHVCVSQALRVIACRRFFVKLQGEVGQTASLP